MRLSTLREMTRALCRPREYGYVGGICRRADIQAFRRKWKAREPLQEGPWIGQFEAALAEYHGAASAVTFGAGRMALFAILKALDLRPGDEVILPGYTCIVTSIAILHAGLRPVYVDVSPEDFNLIPGRVADAVTARTRVILAQHTFGIPCRMDELLAIARPGGIDVVEDGAHAIGSRIDGRVVGTLGRAGFFSTQDTKVFSTGQGGYAVTSDAQLARRILQVQQASPFEPAARARKSLRRWYYRAAWYSRPAWAPRLRVAEMLARFLKLPFARSVLDYDDEEYRRSLAGSVTEPFPTRLGNLAAYAGLLQLKGLEENLRHRRALAAALGEGLPPLGVRVPAPDSQRSQSCWVRFPFVADDPAWWRASMLRFGIQPGDWLSHPIHPRGCHWQAVGYVPESCPNGEFLAGHVVNVPMHPALTVPRLQEWMSWCRRARSRAPR